MSAKNVKQIILYLAHNAIKILINVLSKIKVNVLSAFQDFKALKQAVLECSLSVQEWLTN